MFVGEEVGIGDVELVYLEEGEFDNVGDLLGEDLM